MTKEYFKAPSINMDDPDNLEIFSLASTISGDLAAKEIAPNIHVVSNALTEDDIQYLANLSKTATQEDWELAMRERFEEEEKLGILPNEINKYTKENERTYWFDKSLTVPDREFCESLIERVRPFFGDGYQLNTIIDIHRQKIGEGMDEHSDMGERPELLRAMLFYINDDYEGGELYFPGLDFEYKPKAGDFVTFPSYEKYTHGVRPVLSGSERYVMAGFAWLAKN